MRAFSQQVVRSFLWQGGAQAAGQAIAWLATIVVISLLTPADYGLMAIANVFVGFLFLVSDWGFGAAVVQAQVLDKQHLRRILGIVLVANLAACALTLVAAPAIAAYYDEPRLTAVIRALAINFLFFAAFALPQSQVMREMDFRTKARVEVVAVVLAAVTAFTLAKAGAGVWALVGSALVIHAAKAIGYNVARPMALVPSFSWTRISRLAEFGALITVDRLLFFFYGQVDIMVGGRILGKEAIGLYAVGLSLAIIPAEKVLPVITQVSFAAYSKIQAEPERVRRNLLRSVHLGSLACFPAFFGMAAIAADLVPVVLGSRWVDLVVPFQVLCLVFPLRALAVLFSPALIGVGKARVNLVNMALSLAIMSVAMLIGAQYGVIGLCLAWAIAFPGVFALVTARSLGALSVGVSDFIKRCAFPLIASIVMALAVLGAREALGGLGFSATRLVLLVATGAAVYASLAFLFQRDAIRELIALVRK